MTIDHIGYAVKRIEQARGSFETLGFQFEEQIEDADRNILIQFGEKDNYRIELISPLDKNKSSPIDNIIQKNGPTPYHICYRSENLDREIKALCQKGFKVTIPPAAAVAFGGRKVAFMMNLGSGLLEIVET